MKLTSQQFAALHNLTDSRVRQLCIAGMIKGAVKFGKQWAIPDKAKLPVDARFKKTA